MDKGSASPTNQFNETPGGVLWYTPQRSSCKWPMNLRSGTGRRGKRREIWSGLRSSYIDERITLLRPCWWGEICLFIYFRFSFQRHQLQNRVTQP